MSKASLSTNSTDIEDLIDCQVENVIAQKPNYFEVPIGNAKFKNSYLINPRPISNSNTNNKLSCLTTSNSKSKSSFKNSKIALYKSIESNTNTFKFLSTYDPLYLWAQIKSNFVLFALSDHANKIITSVIKSAMYNSVV